MKKGTMSTAYAKGLAVLLAAGLIGSSMPAALADAKAKKPTVSATKVSVTVGKTKKVKIKNAKKVTWKLSKKVKKVVKLTKKSKKGATIKGLKKGTANIVVKMTAGKKSYKKTIKVTVKKSSAVVTKKPVVNTPSAKGTTQPTPPANKDNAGGSTPTPTPTATPTPPITTDDPQTSVSGSATVVVVADQTVDKSVAVGDVIHLTANVATSGCAVSGDIEWSSTDEAVAAVSGSGATVEVTALGEGTAEITATITTNTGLVVSGSYELTVEAAPPQDYILEGDALGDGASYTYVPNGAALYASMGIFPVDKTKLTEGSTLVMNYTALSGEDDVKDTLKVNVGLKTGNVWNSPAILDTYGKTGGSISIAITADHLAKIGEDDDVYVHVSLGEAGFAGTFTITSVTVGEDSVADTLPDAYTYVESGLPQYAATAKVVLPTDFSYDKYSTCKIEYTVTNAGDFSAFYGVVANKADGKVVEDAKFNTENGAFVVALSKVLNNGGTDPFVAINTSQAGFAGSVTISKITFQP